ncbi:hypothetical protein IT157_01500 [bacterium]|nr:hypothetical protein [bacterium]
MHVVTNITGGAVSAQEWHNIYGNVQQRGGTFYPTSNTFDMPTHPNAADFSIWVVVTAGDGSEWTSQPRQVHRVYQERDSVFVPQMPILTGTDWSNYGPTLGMVEFCLTSWNHDGIILKELHYPSLEVYLVGTVEKRDILDRNSYNSLSSFLITRPPSGEYVFTICTFNERGQSAQDSMRVTIAP